MNVGVIDEQSSFTLELHTVQTYRSDVLRLDWPGQLGQLNRLIWLDQLYWLDRFDRLDQLDRPVCSVFFFCFSVFIFLCFSKVSGFVFCPYVILLFPS